MALRMSNYSQPKWEAKIPNGMSNHKLYKDIYAPNLIFEILNDLKIKSNNERAEMEDNIYRAAARYEFYKHNHTHFHESPTNRISFFKKLETGARKLKNSYAEILDNERIKADLNRYALEKYFLQKSFRENPIISKYIQEVEGQYSINHDQIVEFLEFLESITQDGINQEKLGDKLTDTTPLKEWFTRLSKTWKKYSPVKITEGNPDYDDYSLAVKISKKIIIPLDSTVEEKSLSHIIKELKHSL